MNPLISSKLNAGIRERNAERAEAKRKRETKAKQARSGKAGKP